MGRTYHIPYSVVLLGSMVAGAFIVNYAVKRAQANAMKYLATIR